MLVLLLLAALGDCEATTTIQDAIDNAGACTTITVPAGTYRENVKLNKGIQLVTTEGAVIDPSVQLTGPWSQHSDTNGSGTYDGEDIHEYEYENCGTLVDFLSIDGRQVYHTDDVDDMYPEDGDTWTNDSGTVDYWSGIEALWKCDSAGDKLLLRFRNEADPSSHAIRVAERLPGNNSPYGVWIQSANATVSGFTIRGCDVGIRIHRYATGATVTGNTIEHGRTLVEVRGDNADVSGNNLTRKMYGSEDVTVYNGCAYNARYQGSDDLHVVAQHLGTENKYSFGMLYGVHVYGVSGTVVAANGISVASNAVFVQASDGVTISQNHLNRTVLPAVQLEHNARNVTIDENTFTNTSIGVRLHKLAEATVNRVTTVRDNRFINYDGVGYGIFVHVGTGDMEDNTLTFSGNLFSGGYSAVQFGTCGSWFETDAVFADATFTRNTFNSTYGFNCSGGSLDGFVEGSGQVGAFTDNYFATDPEGSTDLSLADAPWYGSGNLIQANLQAQCE